MPGRAKTTRRVVERHNRETDVIDAAIQVFYDKGYSAASVQDVADVVGVLKGSLYHYISTKEDLLFRIFAGSHTQAMQIMEDVVERNLPPRSRLETYVNEITHWYLANIPRVSIYFTEWRYVTGENAATVLKHRREFSQFFRTVLEEGVDQLRPGVDPALAANYILGAINNIPVWYQPKGRHSAARVASEFAAMSGHLAFR